jgi:hypothetical protein
VKLSATDPADYRHNPEKGMMDERVSRLCQTRRIYHTTSREKAVKYSRKI